MNGLAVLRLAGLVVFVSGVAFGQQTKPSVILAPMVFAPEVKFNKALREQLISDFIRELEGHRNLTVPTRMVSEFHAAKATRKDWAETDEALARLAEAADTRYGMYVYVSFGADPVGQDDRAGLSILARVVGSDRRPARLVRVFGAKGKASMRDLFREQAAKLFEQLRLETLELAAPSVAQGAIEQPPAVVLAPPDDRGLGLQPPPMPPLEARAKPSGPWKPMGYAGLGVGTAALVAGAILFAAAPSVRKDGAGNVEPSDFGILHSAYRQQSAGVALIVGGAVIGGAGGVLLWLVPRADSAVRVSWVPTSGGASVFVGGDFR